uniref:Ribonuclease III n=1 Tax=Pithovirus LCPAC103 TaxID=2506588 RepID=A0A481Z4M2_9VIRU|nr:MAG: ribonuclease III [Pithovirus LCPAC103]
MERWSQLLKKRLLELLSTNIIVGTKEITVVKDEAQRLAIVGDKPLPGEPKGGRTAMDFWRACFTPELLDPRPMHNYEVFETNGDSVLQSITFSLLSEKFPDSVTDEKLTLFKSIHLSKQSMAYISRKFRLPELIRPGTPANMINSESMAEDILEALFGAIYILVNRLFGVGKGTVVTTRLMLLMYGAEPFNLDALRKNPTTEFKEINEELGWLQRGKAIVGSAIKITPGRAEGRYTATMFISNQDVINELRSKGFTILPDQIFATGFGNSETEALETLYQDATRKYQEIGIGEELGKTIIGPTANITLGREKDRHTATMTIIGKEIINGLRAKGFTLLPDQIFATGFGNSEVEARDNMYREAIGRYHEMGIDQRFIATSKRDREINNWIQDNLLLEDVVKRFLTKLGSQGYVNWRFYIPSKDLYQSGSSRRYVKLIAIKADGTEVPLNMASGNTDKKAIAEAVSNYVGF